MRKSIKRVLICGLIAASVWSLSLIRDKQTLRDGLIRLHVVANSDSQQDQEIKLQVRDVVLSSIQKDLESVTDMQQAKAYLQENLPKIQQAANETLKALNFDGEAVVTLCQESFGERIYDTFSLPAGIYESLRITIGDGEGKNWWCVAFPTLCLPSTSEGFTDTAVGAGFSNSLSNTLTREEGYELRFFLLDALGALENKLAPAK